MEREDSYPGLKHKASELSAFAVAIDTFIISLKNKELIRFIPDDPKRFRTWLTAHGIRDVDREKHQDVKPDAHQPKPKRSL
ncbi:hypothetical protein [uncultured Chitinophaga sp.]|jgi:hypothetical protein|uniref:hypothetical protein n=1 Tax=uncultured Chitinophaga sp. TaxID=339340 RepID=UPI002632CE2D|nr:hypothetical protein [uncultured Chitinophaga sp.]